MAVKKQSNADFKARRAEEAVLQFYREMVCCRTLAMLPREEEALKAAGYNPEEMVCIKRFDDETVFAKINVSKPVQIGLKDGGGNPYGF